MDEIVPAFESSMFDPGLLDAGIDMAEIGIDAILSGGILNDVPIAKILVGVYKTGQNIRDRNLLRQALEFITAFNDGTIGEDALNAHRKALEEDPKRVDR